MARKGTFLGGAFVVGSNTHVGKTYVSTCVVRSLRRQGIAVGVYKPAASGCRRVGEEVVADDAVSLWEAADRPETLNDVCRQRFLAPLAPHLAAREEGQAIDLETIRRGFSFWKERYPYVIVEGAGGLLSPLSDSSFVADLAYEFELPLIVVSANQLGTIAQTLQTLFVARHYRGGQKVAAVVLSEVAQIERLEDDPSRATNASELVRRIGEVPFFTVGHGADLLSPDRDWREILRVE